MASRKIMILCPRCKHKFKPGTEKQLRLRLFTHLTIDKRHLLNKEEAEKIIQQVFKNG